MRSDMVHQNVNNAFRIVFKHGEYLFRKALNNSASDKAQNCFGKRIVHHGIKLGALKIAPSAAVAALV